MQRLAARLELMQGHSRAAAKHYQMMIELPGDAGNEAVNESAYELKSKVCAQHNNVPSKDECQQAYDDLKVSNKLEATRPMQLGDWPDLPTGCSVQYDNAAYVVRCCIAFVFCCWACSRCCCWVCSRCSLLGLLSLFIGAPVVCC